MDETASDERVDTIDKLLAPIALKQHSLIRYSDLAGVGGSKHHAATRIAAGRWELCGRKVYRLTGVPWTWQARVLAAVFCAGPGACASHHCAARLHGARGFATASVEISVPRGRFHRPSGATVHTSTDLDRCEIVVVDGIPVTDPARTLLDSVRLYNSDAYIAKVVERFRRDELVTWHDIAICLAAHARKGRGGIRKLRKAMAAGSVNDEITESDAELIALSLLREHEFPEPTLQYELRFDDGEIAASMDFAYLDQLTNFEIDGPHHQEPEQILKDDDRDYWLGQRGWTVRRIPHRVPVDDPRKFLRIVRTTLRDTSAHGR